MLGYGVLFVALMSNNGWAKPMPSVSSAPEVSMSGPSRDSIPVDTVLARRWGELFANVIQEFQRDNRDLVGNIEGDFTTREIKVRATSAGDDDSLWVSRTLSEEELRGGDLQELARELYAEAKRRDR